MLSTKKLLKRKEKNITPAKINAPISQFYRTPKSKNSELSNGKQRPQNEVWTT